MKFVSFNMSPPANPLYGHAERIAQNDTHPAAGLSQTPISDYIKSTLYSAVEPSPLNKGITGRSCQSPFVPHLKMAHSVSYLSGNSMHDDEYCKRSLGERIRDQATATGKQVLDVERFNSEQQWAPYPAEPKGEAGAPCLFDQTVVQNESSKGKRKTISSTNQLIDCYSEYDILPGRGSGPNEHRGNIIFRELANTYKECYCTTSFRSEKKRIAEEIFSRVEGRFLKKGPNGKYKVADKDESLEKIKQFLRLKRTKIDAKSITNIQGTPTVIPAGSLQDPLQSSPANLASGNSDRLLYETLRASYQPEELEWLIKGLNSIDNDSRETQPTANRQTNNADERIPSFNDNTVDILTSGLESVGLLKDFLDIFDL